VVVPALGTNAEDRTVRGKNITHRRTTANHHAGRGKQAFEDHQNILGVSFTWEDPPVVTDMGD